MWETEAIWEKNALKVAMPTHPEGVANKEYIDKKLLKLEKNKQLGTISRSARYFDSQYFYVGELKKFFSQDNNIAVFDIYGQGDYDPDNIEQAHYTLVVRKSGQYKNRLFIDYHLMTTCKDPLVNNWATAYFKEDGSIKLYLKCNVVTTYNAVFIRWSINNCQFEEGGSFSGVFTVPDGYTMHTTDGNQWKEALRIASTAP